MSNPAERYWAEQALTTDSRGRVKGPSARHSWENMIQRCTNPNRMEYKNYGGRGITVCERWRSFASFLEDMGEKPEGMTLDRIDVNQGYCKENCRWADRSTQNYNTRTRSDSKTGIPGVAPHPRGWQAYGDKDGKRTTLYRGADFDLAVQARKAWEEASWTL